MTEVGRGRHCHAILVLVGALSGLPHHDGDRPAQCLGHPERHHGNKIPPSRFEADIF